MTEFNPNNEPVLNGSEQEEYTRVSVLADIHKRALENDFVNSDEDPIRKWISPAGFTDCLSVAVDSPASLIVSNPTVDVVFALIDDEMIDFSLEGINQTEFWDMIQDGKVEALVVTTAEKDAELYLQMYSGAIIEMSCSYMALERILQSTRVLDKIDTTDKNAARDFDGFIASL